MERAMIVKTLIALFVSCASVHGQIIQDPQWVFSFQAPKGWQCQHDATGAMLGHQTISGMILVIPHTAGTPEELRSLMLEGLEEDEVTLYPESGINKGKDNTFSGSYRGVYQGQEIKAKGYGTIAPRGGGAYVIALSTPDKFGSAIVGAAEALVRSMKFVAEKASPVTADLAGTWVTMTKSTETTLVLRSDGQFSTGYVASYSEPGQWGLARDDKSSGRWSARGSTREGSISLVYGDGRRETIQYRVHVENGEVYRNEYWFNGELYGRRR